MSPSRCDALHLPVSGEPWKLASATERSFPMETSAVSERPDYGLDAPRVVRNLFLVGISCLVVWGIAVGVRSGGAVLPRPILALTGICFNLSVLCNLMGFWMIW